ncbi:DUF5815 family protein [Halalkalicoccus sp. NIPERK01]|uniref:DUF5815 family protein n=1 Tax=Halalkalicoccus sp. NIPERK01 TaxID=3053469 RepID=UPI00256EC438|nr:DUF5815 family protein [Halalkalicoccus sp. NIPERK01]MDL5362653.1 DUF5815 family protein [Halalkalicoccus sp. NIPERK01]
MATPRVPGDEAIELPCGESVSLAELDMGMREYACSCGERHAVVMDVHPPSRFVPEAIVDVLRETVETEDEFGEFGTPHVMGIVLEEFPEEVVAEDVSENGQVGYSMLWLTDFDSRRLHVIVVELLVELMDHAISHSENSEAADEFEEQMLEFDVEAFVDDYRKAREFESEFDRPA